MFINPHKCCFSSVPKVVCVDFDNDCHPSGNSKKKSHQGPTGPLGRGTQKAYIGLHILAVISNSACYLPFAIRACNHA